MTTGGNTKSIVPGAVVPDGGWGWIIVFASFMIHFIMDGWVDFDYIRRKISFLKLKNHLFDGWCIFTTNDG